MMYSELIKWLRECASGECFNCSQKGNASCPDDLMKQAADVIERLDAIAQTYVETVHEIEDKRKWIPVTERLPENEVLCINDRQFYLVGLLYCDDVGNYICETDGEIMYDVTHWMPLPNPPESGEA